MDAFFVQHPEIPSSPKKSTSRFVREGEDITESGRVYTLRLPNETKSKLFFVSSVDVANGEYRFSTRTTMGSQFTIVYSPEFWKAYGEKIKKGEIRIDVDGSVFCVKNGKGATIYEIEDSRSVDCVTSFKLGFNSHSTPKF